MSNHSKVVVRVDRLRSGQYQYATVKAPFGMRVAGVDGSPGAVSLVVEEYFGEPVRWTGGAASEMEPNVSSESG